MRRAMAAMAGWTAVLAGSVGASYGAQAGQLPESGGWVGTVVLLLAVFVLFALFGAVGEVGSQVARLVERMKDRRRDVGADLTSATVQKAHPV